MTLSKSGKRKAESEHTLKPEPRYLPLGLVAIVLVLGGISCGRPQAVPQQPAPELIGVAAVGEQPITAAAFQELLARRARSTADPARTLEQKEALLEELVRAEAIYAKAIAAGFDQRPDVAAALKQLIVGKFQEENLASRLDAIKVSEAEVRDYYEHHTSQFSSPAAVSGAVIFLKVGAKAGAAEVARRRQEAESLWQEANGPGPDKFAALAARHSEDQATRYVGGATGWLTRDVQGAGWELPVLDALEALAQPGDQAPLVETPRGFYLVRLAAKRPAGVKPLELVREAIVHQLQRAKEEQTQRDFFAAMKSGLDIQINRELLGSISLPEKRDVPPRLPGAETAQIAR
jgi:parvulin-like peptidyl-prolyl isomerase